MNLDNFLSPISSSFGDFLSIPKRDSLIPREFEVMSNKEGFFYIANGMRTPYLGAFTAREENYLKHMFISFKKKIVITHTNNDRYVDLHLFSGSSRLGEYRVDISSESSATLKCTVQSVLKFLIKHNIKFDLILLDPPYNKRYDQKYGTRKYNCIYKNYSDFLKKLLQEVVKVIADFGLIISKNWRSINLPNLRFVSGIFTQYGGFRRSTILEVYQYIPKVYSKMYYDFPEHSLFPQSAKLLDTKKKIKFFKLPSQLKGSWSDVERSYVNKLINHKEDHFLFIGSNDHDPFENSLEFESVSFYHFTNWKSKSERERKFRLRDTERKYNLIVIDEDNRIGGNTLATSALKVLIRKEIKENGYIFMKSHFNPNLDKLSRFKGEVFNSTLECIKKFILLYPYRKASLIHIYRERQKR